jgi:hypothetical protein
MVTVTKKKNPNLMSPLSKILSVSNISYFWQRLKLVVSYWRLIKWKEIVCQDHVNKI